ncbi:hypothetical protein [Mameliella alba]|uniref:hypothetical protein n=1 Tax=Mameliella alba TaxID=561184 RepID=UPI000B532B97|nr:hypothetical protein [Mameliella alba]OWV61933.1 hypothetical protein CDZ98_05460 [Mameliella alba]
MICDRATQIDIRELVKLHGPLPEVIDFEGERLVTAWTCTAFGGRRQWWLCPSCDRRCAIIYRRGTGPLWGCRLCMGGRYASEHKSVQDRRIQKATKIRKKVGQTSGGLTAPFPIKPKGMHWRTYDQLRAEAQEIEKRVWAAEMAWLDRLKCKT